MFLFQKLETSGTDNSLVKASEQAAYGVTELGIPGLRHFVYKSKLHIQLTMPEFEDQYQIEEEQERY
jgi:hypothetical protein